MKTLMILFAILALSFSQTAVWTDCDANNRQWTAVNVTLEHNPAVKELTTISACGFIKDESTLFDFFTVYGTTTGNYMWGTISRPRDVVAPGEKYCLNDVFYFPNLDVNNITVRFSALNNRAQTVGCIDIKFQNQTSPLIYA